MERCGWEASVPSLGEQGEQGQWWTKAAGMQARGDGGVDVKTERSLGKRSMRETGKQRVQMKDRPKVGGYPPSSPAKNRDWGVLGQ